MKNIINYEITPDKIKKQNYESIYSKSEIKDMIFNKNSTCDNCNIKLNSKYMKLYFDDDDIKNNDKDNVFVLCRECYNIKYPNNENAIIIVFPRRRLDHISQAEIIYYLRFIYILKYKFLEINNKNKNNIKTTSLFEPSIMSDIFLETYDFFEDLVDEVDEVDEKYENFKILIKPENLEEFTLKYFEDDEDKIEEISFSIKILPLFEHTITDFFYITHLLNKLRNKNVKENIKTFISENKEIFNIDFLDDVLDKI